LFNCLHKLDLLGAAAMILRYDKCSICIAVITIEYQITNRVH